MIAMFFDPTQIVGWLLILLSAGILVWLFITRKSPEEIISEWLDPQDKNPVVEGSHKPDDKEIKP